MTRTIVVRWRDWEGDGAQHLVLREDSGGIVAEAAVLAVEEGERFAARFRIACWPDWRVRRVEANVIGDDRRLVLESDGTGNWRDDTGLQRPELKGAIDVDLPITPFTNTLPIRRLGLAKGASADLRVVYIVLPAFTVFADPQRYVCLDPLRRYRYESLDSDFAREIEVDADGLVVTYPDLFRRIG